MPDWLGDPSARLALATVMAIGLACAALSLFIVLRRWAFIGEGISHGGLGGAGTAWLLALAFPAFDGAGAVYAAVAIFCILMALGIGYFTRAGRLSSDTVIGVFLVASVAWGFLAQQIYVGRMRRYPTGFDTLLFGHMTPPTVAFTLLAAGVCVAVVACVALLNKEIVSYCFDPMMAEVSGVRGAAVHYLLIVLMTLTILIGTPVLGSILVIALLVLPGATALLATQRMSRAYALTGAVALVGVVGGLAAHEIQRILPVGPSIVLILFAEFLVAWLATRAWRSI